jgi:hypothetical protein
LDRFAQLHNARPQEGIMPAAQKVATPTDALPADLLGFKSRPKAYKRVKGAAIAEVLDADGTMSGTQVTRGTRVNGGAEAPECLVHVDGSREAGIPLAVITHAILNGVITDAELGSLVEARSRINAAK